MIAKIYHIGGVPSNPQIKALPQPSTQQKPITQSKVQSKVANYFEYFSDDTNPKFEEKIKLNIFVKEKEII